VARSAGPGWVCVGGGADSRGGAVSPGACASRRGGSAAGGRDGSGVDSRAALAGAPRTGPERAAAVRAGTTPSPENALGFGVAATGGCPWFTEASNSCW